MIGLYLKHESAEQALVVPSVTMLSSKNVEHENEDAKVLRKTDSYLREAVEHDSAFYRLTLTGLPPAFIGNRSDINTFCERDTEEWLIGSNTRFGLILLDPRLYKNTAEKHGLIPQTGHLFSEDTYSRTIKHEVGHVYFGALLGTDSRRPFLRWLNEGTQYAAAGQMTPSKVPYETFDPDILENSMSIKFFYQNSAAAVMRFIEVLSRLCIENQIKYLGLFGSFAREDEVAFKFWHLEFRIVAVRQHHIFEFAQ